MKLNNNKLNRIIYIIIYALCCFTISSNKFEGYLSYHTRFLYIKYPLIILLVFVAVLLVKDKLNFAVKSSNIILSISVLIFIIDSFTFKIGGTTNFVRIWWLVAMFISELTLFAALTVFGKSNLNYLYKQFWLGFIPLYAVILFIAFGRSPNTGIPSVNLIIGKGTFSQLGAFIHRGKEALQIVTGNLFAFIPLPIMIKTFFPKFNNIVLLVIGLLLPISIEAYQYIFKCGNTDIDDIILNFGGFLIGFFIYLFINQRISKQKAKDSWS